MKYEISELRSLVGILETNLQQVVASSDDVDVRLRRAYRDAFDHDRTAEAYETWLENYLDQVAVAWVVTSVFVRFLEDNKLVDTPWISGIGDDRDEAAETYRIYFRDNPAHSDTDYFLHIFDTLADSPAGEVFGDDNALRNVRVSGEAAMALREWYRELDPDTGELKRNFQSESGDTRFLGDLYQDLSERAKKKYALLQTPDFVEEFILDYTLEPAVDEFGVEGFRFIDPTCGSGHFLLGGFQRLLDHHRAADPSASQAAIVRRALDGTYGVDLNPFAAYIARFRLTIAALQALSGDDRPLSFQSNVDIPLHIGVGDSLLHGSFFPRFETDAPGRNQLELGRYEWRDELSTEDADRTRAILSQQYHAVVGNPPYITVKDKAPRDAYREHYESCYRQYSLVCPFYERFFELAVDTKHGDGVGFVGMIVANSFMKREFGSKLIEAIIPHTDLTHVVDTSGAYIPGHGTPTVILIGRNQEPASPELTAALGIRGEPEKPDVPAEGKVWGSIVNHLDEPGFENDYISVDPLPRELFHQHPWSLQGGGALEAKTAIESAKDLVLGDIVDGTIGKAARTGANPIFMYDQAFTTRHRMSKAHWKTYVAGDGVRDWSLGRLPTVWYPYTKTGSDILALPTERFGTMPERYWFWPFRKYLRERSTFQGNMLDAGLSWFEYMQYTSDANRTPLSITFAFVATHNHFVLDRGGKVFKQSAPVIKLPEDATEDDHLGLLGLLNSSVGCFWMKQVFHNKGNGGIGGGIGDEMWEPRYEFDSTKTRAFPLPGQVPLRIAKKLDQLGAVRSMKLPSSSRLEMISLDDDRRAAEHLLMEMVAYQEELDWRCYKLFGLLDESPLSPKDQELPLVARGERAFEIVLARKQASGQLRTAWFDRNGGTPTTEVPARWPRWYRELVEARIRVIEQVRFIRLIEKPEYKRRWHVGSWEDLESDALEQWMKNRLESERYFPESNRSSSADPALTTIRRLTDTASADEDFIAVAERYTGTEAPDIYGLVRELVLDEAVPFLPSQRYEPSGIKRRKVWEKVWDLQRREDAGEAVKIPKPPNYRKSDFQDGTTYSLRSKLDVPKERFTLYPGLERDGEPVVSWAGLDHKQRAKALAEFYYEVKQTEGWPAERLALALAGLLDLTPWVKQWHDDDSVFLEFLERTVPEEARQLGLTLADLENIRMDDPTR